MTRWFKVGLVGSILTGLACLTPIAALVLSAAGLAAWIGWIDTVVVPILVAFLVLAVYRAWLMRRKPS